MAICIRKPNCFFFTVLIAALFLSNIFPVAKLGNKSANSDVSYSAGWKEGCEASTNASSPLRPFLLAKPFVTEVDTPKTNYKLGWNEGYTTCHFTRLSIDSWIQTFVIVAALLFLACAVNSKSKQD